MSSPASLLSLAEYQARGPSPSFGPAHLLLAFLTIGDSQSIGRQSLARKTRLGEGATRTVLRKLKDGGFVSVDASGCHLSPAGARLYLATRKVLTGFHAVPGAALTLGNYQVAIAVRKAAQGVESGIEQRDAAIRLGAIGTTTYTIKGGKFTIPRGSRDCEKDFPGPAWRSLRTGLTPSNGDVVILSGASDELTAKLGALAAASTLL